MTETVFHVKTQKDFNALIKELELFGCGFNGTQVSSYWGVYKQYTVIYADTESHHLMYGSKDHFEINNHEETLHVFKEGMKLSLDATGFHIDTTVTYKDIAKATPSNAESVSDSIQQLMVEHGVVSVTKGIEHWLTRNGFGTAVTEPVEPRYTVILPNPNVSKGAQLIVLRKQDTQPDSKLQLCKIKQSNFYSGSEMYQLTEAEIKKDFDWAWQFAQEVK